MHGSDSLGIFPGAIVGVKGKNVVDKWFAVNEVYSVVFSTGTVVGVTNMSFWMQLPALQRKEGARSNVHPFSICAMSGPYTSDADLQYKHLETVLERVKAHHPDVLLLVCPPSYLTLRTALICVSVNQLGPFVDASHPLIKVGDVDYTPKEMFELHFVERLRSLLASQPDLMILLVPSVKDILSDHAVLPQSELERDLFPDPVS
jgi:DNA polymerase alpha subunit B